jgi:hypothetical protein
MMAGRQGLVTGLAQGVPSDAITHTPLKKGSACCLMAKGLKVCSGEFSLNQDKGMYVPMGAMVIMKSGNKLNLFA